ncbi:MAG: hypothetical protein U0324_30165 [Polyangiales bacterium]
MPAFQPRPGSVITIDVRGGVERLRVLPHPQAPSFAFACEGGEGVVVQVEREGAGARYAFKVMKPASQRAELPVICGLLRSFAGGPGLRACERYCVCEADSPRTWAAAPALRYAMIIPWIEGPTWLDVLLSRRPLPEASSTKAARSFANCMALLESVGASHGDIASGNVILTPDSCEAQLIDVEHMHAPGFTRPSVCVLGTPGYNRVDRTDDLWSPASDRMALGIMVCEMLAWRDAAAVAASEGGSYFSPDELGDERCDRFRLMLDVLGRLSPQLPPLLRAVWRSRRRAECPPARAWCNAVEGLGTIASAATLPDTRRAPGAAVPQTRVLSTPPIVPPDVRGPTPVAAPAPSAAPPPVVAWSPIAPPARSSNPIAFWRQAAPAEATGTVAVVQWGADDPTVQEPS